MTATITAAATTTTTTTTLPRKKKQKKKNKLPKPILPPPLKSRRKARIITTQFHKYTRELSIALQQQQQQQQQQNDHKSIITNNEKIEEIKKNIEELGGREMYQEASQLSTRHFSTSKWVLKCLGRRGWLNGIPLLSPIIVDDDDDNKNKSSSSSDKESITTTTKNKKQKRRNTTLLEVGAINTELIDVATTAQNNNNNNGTLDVTAIDLRSSHPLIIESDFLTHPFRHSSPHHRYDVIVCSMVINSVTNPEDRGRMLVRLYHHLRPGGLCFLTLPKLCLRLSKYMTEESWRELLEGSSGSGRGGGGGGGVGFVVEETKETPKVSFFVLRRPEDGEIEKIEKGEAKKEEEKDEEWWKKWKELKVVRRGKKYRNDFGVVLKKEFVRECCDSEQH